MDKKKRLQRFLESGLMQDLFNDKERTHTRRINPNLGFLGVFGFMGFTGFIPTALNLTFVLTAPSFFFVQQRQRTKQPCYSFFSFQFYRCLCLD